MKSIQNNNNSHFYLGYYFVLSLITMLSFCYLGPISGINSLVGYIATFLCGLSIIVTLRKGFKTRYSLLLTLFSICFFIPTVLSGDPDFTTPLFLFVRVLGFSLCTERLLSTEPNKTIKILSKILQSLVLINFLTIILFPNGLYSTARYDTNWFFMYDNTHIMWYLAAILLSIIDRRVNNSNKYTLLALLAIIAFCVFYCMSATSVVTFVFLVINLIIIKIKGKTILTYFKGFVAYLLLNYLIVFLNIQYLFEWFIVGVLGKKLTFTGRTIIWERTVELITKRPLLGYGYETTSFSEKVGSIFYTHAHNTILDVCYRGGVAAVALFILMLLEIGKSIKQCKDKIISSSVAIIMFCCFIVMTFEAREDKIGLYIIFIIAASINFLFKKEQAK